MFFIQRYSEFSRAAINGFFYHDQTLPKDHCDSIVKWGSQVDITGFTEDIHADMFTGDPKWKPERNRTTYKEVLEDLGIYLYDLFPDCKSPLLINWDILRSMKNVEMDFAPLPSTEKTVWFLQKREYDSDRQGEQKAKWVRMTETEVLEAIASGDIILGGIVRDAARTVFGKKGADWIVFEINNERVLKANNKMVDGFRFEPYFAKDPSRLVRIQWSDAVSPSADPCDLNVLCDDFNTSISKIPSPYTNRAGEPIDVRQANWENKVRLDWRTYYPLYLKSAEWYLVRQVFFMVLDGSPCTSIGCDTEATQIHHLSYMTIGCERFVDLIPLCRRCHSYFHQRVNVLEKSDVEEIQRRHENREDSPDPCGPLQITLRLN